MNIATVQKVKDAVNMFKNASFISIVEEGKVLVENEKSQGQYIISYIEDGDTIIFDTEKAECVAKPKTTSEYAVFKNNCDKLQASLKNVFHEEKFDVGIKKLKQTIKTLPVVDSKAILEDVKKRENKNEYSWNETIQKLFGKAIKKYEEEKAEFEKLFSLFDEDDKVVDKKVVDLTTLRNKLTEQAKNYEIFTENAKKFYEVKKQLNHIFVQEQVTNKFFENFDLSKNLKNTVTSKLVKIINEDKLNLNIQEALPKVMQILENQYTGIAGTPAPVVYNLASDNKFKTPGFFKFKVGAYSQDDVKKMINEMDFFMSCIGDHDEESLHDISNNKMILEYMYHSGQINDHLIDEMIRTFNGKYAKDQSADYNDPTKRLAWQNRDQMKEFNAQGYAQ